MVWLGGGLMEGTLLPSRVILPPLSNQALVRLTSHHQLYCRRDSQNALIS